MQSSKGEGKFRAKLLGALVLVLLATQLVGCGWYLRPRCKPCGPYYGNGYGPGGAYGRGAGAGNDANANGWGANGPGGEDANGANKPRFGGEAKYMLDTIYFDFDQSNLRSDQNVALERNLAWMKQNPNAPIRVEGHCDERGTEEYNFALGDRRADAVRQWMIENGVDPGRMQSVSKGELEPADPGHDESAWAKNRRAEFLVLE